MTGCTSPSQVKPLQAKRLRAAFAALSPAIRPPPRALSLSLLQVCEGNRCSRRAFAREEDLGPNTPATTAAVLCNEAGLALHGGAVVALRERHGVRACRGWVGRHVGPWAPYIRLC